MAPSAIDPEPTMSKSAALSSATQLQRFDAKDPATTSALPVEAPNQDGGMIVENLISTELAAQIKGELKPYFDTDRIDKTVLFPRPRSEPQDLSVSLEAVLSISLSLC
jgi:hypothetical protein